MTREDKLRILEVVIADWVPKPHRENAARTILRDLEEEHDMILEPRP